MDESFADRRRFHFSLRGLLVLVALLALGMGWVHAARYQRQAVTQLQQSNPNAAVLYDDEVAADGRTTASTQWQGPEWLRQRIGPDYLSSVAGVELTYATDADLARVARLPHLRRLNLARSIDVTDAGLERLAGLKHLKLLALSDADRVTDRGLQALGRLKSLTCLRLDLGRRMTPAGIAALKRALPGCRIEINANEEDQVLAFNTLCEYEQD